MPSCARTLEASARVRAAARVVVNFMFDMPVLRPKKADFTRMCSAARRPTLGARAACVSQRASPARDCAVSKKKRASANVDTRAEHIKDIIITRARHSHAMCVINSQSRQREPSLWTRAPTAQQNCQVSGIGGAALIEVAHARQVPTAQQRGEVGAVHHMIKLARRDIAKTW